MYVYVCTYVCVLLSKISFIYLILWMRISSIMRFNYERAGRVAKARDAGRVAKARDA